MRIAAVAFATLLGVAAPAAAGNGAVHGPSKCTAQKLKAFGAYQQGIAACRSKAVAKGELVDEDCVAKAENKAEKAFAKAEKKDDCLETRDLDFVLPRADDYLDRAATVLEGHPICCESAGPTCRFVTALDECAAAGGAAAAIGTVCGPSGGCFPPPAAAGACCQLLGGGIGNGCVTGLSQGACESAGAFHLPSATCEPVGACVIAK
jgi:hypothetical protein